MGFTPTFGNHGVRDGTSPSHPPLWGTTTLEVELFLVYVVATKPIRAGEEILLDYGETYWDSRSPRPRILNPQRLVIDYL